MPYIEKARQKKIMSMGPPRIASIIPNNIYISQRRILEIERCAWYIPLARNNKERRKASCDIP